MSKLNLTVYEPLGIGGYEICQPSAKSGFGTVDRLIDGTARGSIWKPLAVELVREGESGPLRPSDSPWYGSNALVFRDEVVRLLGDVLLRHGELLPLACDEAELFIFNPTFVIDALTADARALRFEDGRVMAIAKYVFDAAQIGRVEIFKIPNLDVSPTYVTQAFAERWKASGLHGLEFRRLWPTPLTAGGLF